MKTLTRVFSLYLLLLGVSAVYGAWAIIYTDIMKFPPDLLDTTPFDSYLIPGIILGFVVGGTQFVAAFLLWMGNTYKYEATAVAGFALLIWMITEVYMIPSHHTVQIVFTGFAIVTLIVLMFFLKYMPVDESG